MSGRATSQWSGRRKAALIVIALVLLALLAAPVVGMISSRRASTGDLKLAADLPQSQRAERERTIAEHVERAQSVVQGGSGDQLLCAAQELGEEPAPNAPGQTRVYAWILCRSTGAAQSATSTPISVDVDGQDGPVVRFLPQEGAGFAPSVREHFPSPLHTIVLTQEGIDLERLTRELEQR